MKARKFIVILAVFLAVTAAVFTFYAGRQFLFYKLKSFLINKIETSTALGIKIEEVTYAPSRGIRLAGVSLYRSVSYKQKLLDATYLYIKFPLLKFLLAKTFSPALLIHELKAKDILVNGVVGTEIKRIEITSPEDALKAIKNVWCSRLSIKGTFLNIENANGAMDVAPDSIEASRIDFVLNGEPCRLAFDIADPLGEFSSEFRLSSGKINLVSKVKKEKEIYKISEIKGNAFNSPFDFVGEFSNGPPRVLSLYGKANIDIKDALYFAPRRLKQSVGRFNPEGVLQNSVYFKTQIGNAPEWELGVKSSAEYLKLGNVRLDSFRMDTRINNALVTIPLLNAYLYNGALSARATLDLTDERLPYEASCKLSNINVGPILEQTNLKGKNIKGTLLSEFTLRGEAKNIDSMRGTGRVVIKNANLGPMPLLTPLLGNVYGYLRHALPELKKVNIQAGSADFYIANRKVQTDNLVLSGELIGIYAKGYVDFDKNLYFEVENQISGEPIGGGDWQAGLQEMIVQFGKLVSKARLTGTLEKPKWKFEYFGGMENVIKGGLQELLKGIFE